MLGYSLAPSPTVGAINRERNDLRELLQSCQKTEGLAWSSIQAALESPEVGDGVSREVCALWHILTRQPIGVLVRPALPGGEWGSQK